MKIRWINWLDRAMSRVDGRMASAVSVVFLAFVFWALPAASQAGVDVGLTQSIDTSFGMSADQLWAIAEGYGATIRQAYILQRWTFDVVWPIVYTSFFMISSLYLGKKIILNIFGKMLLLIIPLGVLFDFLENSLVSLVFALFPIRIIGLTEAAVLMTPIKWGFVSSSMILVLGLAGVALVRPWIKKIRSLCRMD